MVSKARADQVSGGVFLIGLALLFMTGYWWPGILFVIGASTMARGVGRPVHGAAAPRSQLAAAWSGACDCERWRARGPWSVVRS